MERHLPTDFEPGEPGPPPPDLLGADEELVAGRHPVEEAFVARREALRLLVVPQRRHALERLVLHATNLRIPIVEVEGGTLTALAGFDGHQGVALVTRPRRFASLDDVLARAIERGEAPFVLALDSLEDPQNLGTLLRSADAAGIHGVIFPTRRQAPLSPAAIKASSGAVEHLLLVPVDDLAGALTDLHVRGLRIVGAEAEAPMTARQADMRGPVALVVGSEGQGLGPAVRRRCDLMVRIPMRGAIASLNAAVAGSVLLYEASAQRDAGLLEARGQETSGGPATPPPAEPEAAAEAAPKPRARRSRKPAAEGAPQAEPEAAAEAAPEPRARRSRKPAAEAAAQAEASQAEPSQTEPEPVRPEPARPSPEPELPEDPAAEDEQLLPGGPGPNRTEPAVLSQETADEGG